MTKRIAVWGIFDGYGGIERMIINFYKNIDKNKIQYDFLVPHNLGKMSFEDEILEMGGRIFRILYSESESLIKARKCWKDYFKEHPEVIGVHIHANFPYALPLVIAKQCKVPIRILHSHNSDQKNRSTRVIDKIRDIQVARQITKAPNIYFACSDGAADYMFPGKQYTWIKNGIYLDKFMFNQDFRVMLREQYDIKKNDIVIGQIGHLSDVKNSLFTVEVFYQLVKKQKNYKLVFIGGGPLENRVRERVQELDIKENVIFTGVIHETYQWYSAIDVLMMPSLYEGFPVVLIEAQAAGLPCVISDTITKQVEVTDLIHYCRLDSQYTEWIEKIERLGNEPKERQKYYEMVKDKGFDIGDCTRELENIYLKYIN